MEGRYHPYRRSALLKTGNAGEKIKNVKGGIVVKGFGIGIIESEDGSVVDVIDERGFVDGVKVAQKRSKANVLGTVMEYIPRFKETGTPIEGRTSGIDIALWWSRWWSQWKSGK